MFPGHGSVLIREMGVEDIDGVSEVVCACYSWLGERNGYTEGQVDLTQRVPGPITVLGLYKELDVTQ